LLGGDDLPKQALVKDITDALALAKDDSKIGLVVLDLDKLKHGLLPKLETISNAINDFQTSGKKVIAVANNYSQSALYIAAHADEVLLNPEGFAVPEGFAIYRPYFKSFLEKHDVSVEVFKVGTYKAAVDPFLRDSMSEEDKEAWNGILNGWWSAYTDEVESSRNLSAGSVNAMLQNAAAQLESVEGNLARLALEKGFVDRLVTNTERDSYLIELAGEDTKNRTYRGVEYKKYLRAKRKPVQHKSNKVAVITAVGNIFDGKAPAGDIGSESLSKLIKKARLDEKVKAIVLRIDSGGGSKTASEIIRSELQTAQDAGIPVVASMGSFAASGGYWIAATADEIWASPTTITGSIGIFGLMPSFEKTLANQGIYSDGVSTTPIAGGASLMRGVTPEYGDLLQTVIESGYQQFITTVAEGRDMDVDAVDEIAQGRIWTGEKAQEIGLVDQLGGLQESILAAASLANMDDYSVWHVKPKQSFEEKLLSTLADTTGIDLSGFTDNPITKYTSMIKKEMGFLGKLNDPNNVYVICGDCIGLQ